MMAIKKKKYYSKPSNSLTLPNTEYSIPSFYASSGLNFYFIHLWTR